MLEKKSDKSQAALEFLTTYGWAFLIIIIMIGVLAYFGVLSPSKLLPNRCNFGPEFQCVSYQISATNNEFKLRLKNGLAGPITIESMSVGTEGATGYTCTNPTPLASWKAGNTTDFVWTSCNSAAAGLIAGEKGKVLVTIRYHPVLSGPAYSSEVKGEVFSSVI